MMISPQRTPQTTWFPRELIKRIAEQELEEFCRHVVGPFLVVRLDDFSSQLAAGFEASRPSAPMDRPRRAHTLSFVMGQEERTVTVSVSSSLRPAPPPSRPALNEFRSAPELLQSSCYVLEIKKRRLEPPASTISVGRGPENDIVLQHPSVSKLHAQFESNDGRLSVSDAGSRNHTYVNDEIISERVPLAAGEAVKFGAVRCMVCSPAGLWQAIGR